MIEKEEYYSLKEIKEKKLLPMFRSTATIKNWLNRGLIQSVNLGQGVAKRYRVKGEWLIEFIAKWESGDFK